MPISSQTISGCLRSTSRFRRDSSSCTAWAWCSRPYRSSSLLCSESDLPGGKQRRQAPAFSTPSSSYPLCAAHNPRGVSSLFLFFLTLRVAANQSAHKKLSCAKQCKDSGLRRLSIIELPATETRFIWRTWSFSQSVILWCFVSAAHFLGMGRVVPSRVLLFCSLDNVFKKATNEPFSVSVSLRSRTSVGANDGRMTRPLE